MRQSYPMCWWVSCEFAPLCECAHVVNLFSSGEAVILLGISLRAPLDSPQEAGMLVHSFTIGAQIPLVVGLPLSTSSSTSTQAAKMMSHCADSCLLCAAGIAFGANTNQNTIVALIIALCFHVSSCLPYALSAGAALARPGRTQTPVSLLSACLHWGNVCFCHLIQV